MDEAWSAGDVVLINMPRVHTWWKFTFMCLIRTLISVWKAFVMRNEGRCGRVMKGWCRSEPRDDTRTGSLPGLALHTPHTPTCGHTPHTDMWTSSIDCYSNAGLLTASNQCQGIQDFYLQMEMSGFSPCPATIPEECAHLSHIVLIVWTELSGDDGLHT